MFSNVSYMPYISYAIQDRDCLYLLEYTKASAGVFSLDETGTGVSPW